MCREDERQMEGPPEPGDDGARDSFGESLIKRLGRKASELVAKQYYRTAVNVQNKTLEEFGRMERGSGVRKSQGLNFVRRRLRRYRRSRGYVPRVPVVERLNCA